MKPPAPKKVLRCAIYTRKSTEHNLDLEFNSLDAQREASEAYIKSQAHEGWRLLPERYDDGGLSGASLDRPAVQILLADIRSGKIDIVVVYKVDRLTRSLADFAKLVELFDAHGVSFVSVTQAFNTTSSMGRLTLNVLLSFAQFEREVIGERVRDKIAASKRKGIWVGGPVPLGYTVVDKKVLIVPEEAETVRFIFRSYLALGSIGALLQELNRNGVRTKRQTLATGRVRGGLPFGTGAVSWTLKNRFYIGEVAYRGGIYPGEQEPILDRELFDAVQDKLAATAGARRVRMKDSPHLLTGRLFDDRGNPMTPTHSSKHGVRYRYYVSHPLLQKRKGDAGSVPRAPAPEIESMVVEALRSHLADIGFDVPDPTSDRSLIEQHVERIVLRRQAIEICVVACNDFRQPDTIEHEHSPDGPTMGTDDDVEHKTAAAAIPTVLSMPWTAPRFEFLKGVQHAPVEAAPMQAATRDALLTAIAKARFWIDDIVAGRVASLAEIATREGKVERHIRLLAPLAFVAPAMVASIANSTAPANLTVTGLAQALPYGWISQERGVG